MFGGGRRLVAARAAQTGSGGRPADFKDCPAAAAAAQRAAVATRAAGRPGGHHSRPRCPLRRRLMGPGREPVTGLIGSEDTGHYRSRDPRGHGIMVSFPVKGPCARSIMQAQIMQLRSQEALRNECLMSGA